MIRNRYTPIGDFNPTKTRRDIAIDVDRDIFNDITALRAYVSILRANQDNISVKYLKNEEKISEHIVLEYSDRPKFGFNSESDFLPKHVRSICVLTSPANGYIPVCEDDLVCVTYRKSIDKEREKDYWTSKGKILKPIKKSLEISDSELGFLARYGLNRLLINFGTIDDFLDNWRPINSGDLK